MPLKYHSITGIVSLSTENCRIFGWSRSRKWQQSSIRSHESSLFDLTQKAIWASQEAEKISQCLATTWNIASLNSHNSHFEVLKRLIMNPECLATTWNIDFSTSNKSHFVVVKRPKMSSNWHASPWNIAFSTSPKSHFRLVKRLKMISHCLVITWNIALSTSLKSHFGLAKYQRAMTAVETSFYLLHPSRIMGFSRWRKWLFSAIR